MLCLHFELLQLGTDFSLKGLVNFEPSFSVYFVLIGKIVCEFLCREEVYKAHKVYKIRRKDFDSFYSWQSKDCKCLKEGCDPNIKGVYKAQNAYEVKRKP